MAIDPIATRVRWAVWIVGAEAGPAGHAVQYEFARNFYQFIGFSDPAYDVRKLGFGVV